MSDIRGARPSIRKESLLHSRVEWVLDDDKNIKADVSARVIVRNGGPEIGRIEVDGITGRFKSFPLNGKAHQHKSAYHAVRYMEKLVDLSDNKSRHVKSADYAAQSKAWKSTKAAPVLVDSAGAEVLF